MIGEVIRVTEGNRNVFFNEILYKHIIDATRNTPYMRILREERIGCEDAIEHAEEATLRVGLAPSLAHQLSELVTEIDAYIAAVRPRIAEWFGEEASPSHACAAAKMLARVEGGGLHQVVVLLYAKGIYPLLGDKVFLIGSRRGFMLNAPHPDSRCSCEPELDIQLTLFSTVMYSSEHVGRVVKVDADKIVEAANIVATLDIEVEPREKKGEARVTTPKTRVEVRGEAGRVVRMLRTVLETLTAEEHGD